MVLFIVTFLTVLFSQDLIAFAQSDYSKSLGLLNLWAYRGMGQIHN